MNSSVSCLTWFLSFPFHKPSIENLLDALIPQTNHIFTMTSFSPFLVLAVFDVVM